MTLRVETRSVAKACVNWVWDWTGEGGVFLGILVLCF